jgi:hypothetical protein
MNLNRGPVPTTSSLSFSAPSSSGPTSPNAFGRCSLATPQVQYVEGALVWPKGPDDDISPAIRKASTDLGLVAFNIFHPEYMHWVRNKPDPEDHVTIGYVHHTL